MFEDRAKLLVVDDTKANIDILLELLEDDYDVAVALNGQDALDAAKQDEPDLILLDIMMPGMDGYEVCTALKANAATRDIPVIFITGKSDEASIEQAFDVGGVDYLSKPFKPKELMVRLRTHLQLRQLIAHLEYVSSHDKMTGLFNRGKFFELAQGLWNKDRNDICAAMLDIDQFKRINDNHGHPVGDRVIQGVAKVILKQLGSHAVCARVGGEEFAVVWPSSDSAMVQADLEAIRAGVVKLIVTTDAGVEVRCTISSGSAMPTPEMQELDDVLKEADDALYQAKGSGRNRTIFRGSRAA